MSAWKSLSPALRGALTAAVLALVGLGLWLWQGGVAPEADAPGEVAATDAEPAPAETPAEEQAGAVPSDEAPAGETLVPVDQASADEASAPVEEAQTDPAPEAEPQPDTAATEAPAAPLPSFDVVRVEADGNAVIAGKAAPGDSVTLLLDGAPIAEATADSRGGFVALTTLQPGPQPRVLTLLAKGEAGERRSEASVIVAPKTVVAEGTPEEGAGEEATVETAALSEEPSGQADAPAETGPVRTEAPQTAPDAPAAPGEDSAPDATVAASSPAASMAPDTQGDAAGPDATAEQMAAEPAQAPTEVTGGAPTETVAADPSATAAADASATATPVARPQPVEPSTTTARAADPTTPAPAGEALPAAETPAAPEAEQVATARPAPPVTPAGPEEPQLLVATGEGLRVLQPSSAASEVPLRVETIGYREGAVTLSGRGTGGPSDLRIYLDNDPVAVTPLDTDGTWTAELEDVTPGTYTLRVDQLAQDGKVTGRFETPFLRESDEALARNAPAETSPEGLAISVITVQPGYSLWAIATDRYGDGMEYHKVLAANRSQIRDPDLIYPGQIFDLPD